MNLGWEDEPWDWEAEDGLETQSTGWGAEDSRPGTPGSWAEDFGVPGEVSSPPQVDWVSRSPRPPSNSLARGSAAAGYWGRHGRLGWPGYYGGGGGGGGSCGGSFEAPSPLHAPPLVELLVFQTFGPHEPLCSIHSFRPIRKKRCVCVLALRG